MDTFSAFGDPDPMADLDDPKRLSQFTSSITQLDADGVLEDCVKQAAELAGAPLALVTFVMSKIQLFRASVGLPPELAASRATNRCDSFCQFVVKSEEPFLVTDAKNDNRVPKAMVDAYGIASYLGVPIRNGGQVLGSLCVADGKAREWPSGVVDEIRTIADRVSNRLEELSATGRERNAGGATDPKSLPSEVLALTQVIQRSLVEVGPMVRLAQGASGALDGESIARAARLLTEASDFYDDMMLAVAELGSKADRLARASA